MKRAVLFFAVITFGLWAYAQPRAIGGRTGSAIEASYQHTVGKNMVSIDFGFVYDIFPVYFHYGYGGYGYYYYSGSVDAIFGVEAVVTYDWIFNIKAWTGKGEWNWYAGVGLGAGYHRYVVYGKYGAYSEYGGINLGYVGAAGRIGVEYNFWFPLQLSFDWRPVIGPIFNGGVARYYVSGLYAGAFCIGVRYKF